MNIMKVKTWLIFYIACAAGLLWASFLLTQGIMLGFAFTIMMIVMGFNFILISGELKEMARREQIMRELNQPKKRPSGNR
ncbi:MAG: hypothetical protein NT074_01025 [Methanomicrobiales archaeon]|jgi:predicted membrane protein|nr:hypothetical protein [Methanomicrobiales archaeon]